ncbi:MAG: glutamine--fructose-6-phosphate transaminase (isomerizing) [Thermoplasmata archaeon]
MCGIFGIVFKSQRQDLGRILIDAGKRLTYRGYDSVGCAAVEGVDIEDDKIDLRKDTGTIDDVSKKYNFAKMKGIRGMIQLRWATFGRPSKLNAQPFFGCDTNIVGCTNGNIVNTAQLREKYMAEGHTIRSWNDGEVLVHAIEKCYNDTRDMKKAIMLSAKELHGDYAYVVTTIYDNTMHTVKKGSSLYLGVGKDFICCSSDLPSILPLTRMIVTLNDNEFVEFTWNKYNIYNLADGSLISRKPVKSQFDIESATKEGYPHFMLKEIHEQPSRVDMLLKVLEESQFVEKFFERLNGKSGRHNMYLMGSGSSYNACVTGAYYFNKLAHMPAIPVIAGQFIDLYGNALTDESVIVCVSQSGETKDVINVVNYCKKIERGTILGMINVLGSTLMLNSDVYLPLACDLEVSVPATKTFMNQVVSLYYLALKLGGEKGTVGTRRYEYLMSELRKLPQILDNTIRTTELQCKTIASDLARHNDSYCLGYGVCHGIALEGALKIKEITYGHCEGMYSSEFKHGPLSIIDEGYPVIYVTTPEDTNMIISHMNEVSCRNGRVITIAEESSALRKHSHDYIMVPTSSTMLAPILNVIPLQLISYYWSVAKGINPDQPRNLSKTLTVD